MEPTSVYYKTKRNLLFFVGALLLSIFVGFKISDDGSTTISILPFEISRPELLPSILAIGLIFNIFQFLLHWASQNSQIQSNTFFRIDFISTFLISIISFFIYLIWLAWDRIYSLLKYSTGLYIDGSRNSLYISIFFVLVTFFSVLLSLRAARTSEQIGRFLKSRASRREDVLFQMLTSRRWTLVFDPKNSGQKEISFEPDGAIGIGSNNNEYSWKIRNGLLEIYNSHKQLYSRFRFNDNDGEFQHTNDDDTLSIRSQRIVEIRPS